MAVLERGIHQLLSGFAGGRIYALRAPQNSPTPFVIFQRIASDRWRDINAPSGVAKASIQIDVYDTSYYSAKTLAKQIEDLLDGYHGTVSYGGSPPSGSVEIQAVVLEDDSDIIDETDAPVLFRNNATYLITYTQ